MAGLAKPPQIGRRHRLERIRHDAEPLQGQPGILRRLRHHIVDLQQLDLVRRQLQEAWGELQQDGLQLRQREYVEILGRRDLLQAQAGSMKAAIGSASPDMMMSKASLVSARESFSPAAMRICSRTRSMPVIASVTGCSTWRRVFISMKAN